MAEENKRKLYCNRCLRETNQNLRGTYRASASSGDGFEESEDCSLYECAGCEAPTLLVEYSNNIIEPESEITLYPERTADWRSPKRFLKLPRKLTQTYNETVAAYNRGSLLLSTIGLRALIEGVCDDKGANGRTLEKKINALSGHFGHNNITSYLHGFRFSGNDAAHQLEALTRDECSDAITVMEDLLNYLYDLDYKASCMKHARRSIAPSSASKAGAQP